MKMFLKSGLLLALGLLLYSSSSQAQMQARVNAPYWGPVVDPNVQYYYIPEIDGYYDLYTQSYLFYDRAYGAWVSSPGLPRAYASYDPRFFHPVVIQYVGRQPWGYLRDHRAYCDRWGVAPGRYYGANWPGRGYVVAPRPNYGPGGYYNRPGNYARNDFRDNRDNRDRDRSYGGYDRRDDHRGNQGGYNGRREEDGRNGGNPRNDRNSQGGYTNPSSPSSQPSYGGRRGRVAE